MRGRRGGFTLVELLIFVLLVGILFRIAAPAYSRYVYKARAAVVLADIQAVRVAAYAYYMDAGRWPADVNRGVVPPELVPYLGTGFTFRRDTYLLDWDYWSLPDGTPSRPETGTLVGVSLTTTDPMFGQAFVALLGDNVARATIGDHYTFVVVGSDDSP